MSQSKPKLRLPSEALDAKIDYVDLTSNSQTKQESNVLHAFRVDNIGLLLQSGMTSELLQNLSICSLPNTNRVLYGMGNLRGNIIPVFDLRCLFGMPECENKYFLVIDEGENAVAILLDQMPLQMDIREEYKLNSLPPMPSILRPFVNDVYHSDGLWVDCDLMSFFESLRDYIN
jgi:twitching motility protein PilI